MNPSQEQLLPPPVNAATEPANPQPSSTAEWISLAIAATLLMGVIGLVGYLWASDEQRQPPILNVKSLAVRQSAGEFYIPFEIINSGGETAESVQVTAELQINGLTVETGEQILEFLSSQERAEGAFIFTRNPQQGEVIIRVASYQRP